jgi:hypothetical protein
MPGTYELEDGTSHNTTMEKLGTHCDIGETESGREQLTYVPLQRYKEIGPLE